MALYSFRCDSCGSTSSAWYPMSEGPQPHPHTGCGTFQRVWTVPAQPKSFQPHFNHSVGRYVNTMAEFNAALARGADEASARTGVEHRYRAADRDAAPDLGVTDNGTGEQTAKVLRDSGQTQPASRTFV